MRHLIVISTLLATLLSGCVAEEPNTTEAPTSVSTPESDLTVRLDAYFEPLAEAREFNGTVLVQRGEQTLYARAFGYADMDKSIAMTMETPLAIASLTKTFTAGAILKLIQDGVIAMDDPLSDFIPDFPKGDEITVHLLLMHASGLQNPDVSALGDRKLTSAELAADIASRPLLFTPGEESRYSNAGYSILARIIEIASDQTYQQYLKDSFWAPLGMATIFDGGTPPESAPLRDGYIPGPDGPISTPAMNYTTALGAGSLLSASPDLGRWLLAVGDQTYFNVFDGDWPYGWGRASVMDHEGIEQTGAVSGYVSVMQIYPDDRLAIAVLSNIENGTWARWGEAVATLVLGGDEESPATPPTLALSTESLRAFVGLYEGGEWRADVRLEDGHLWAYLNGMPTGKYLKPIDATVFAIPSDVGRIEFKEVENDRYQSFEWELPWGDVLRMERTD